MGKGYRKGRLGEEIRKIISDLLLKEIKDPRLSGLVTISAVEAAEDGSHALVYISVFGQAQGDAAEKEKEDVLQAFQSAKGLIKREIGRQIKLRHVPELAFKLDTSLDYGRHISKLIDELGITEDTGETKEVEAEEEVL